MTEGWRYSQVDLDDGLRVWRSFKLGKLVDLIILDTRNYDRSITELGVSQNEFNKVLQIMY